ncbi:MAG: BON domain-containing protein [Bdellovibrio sp.]
MAKINRNHQTQDEHTANKGEASSFLSQKDLNERYRFTGDSPSENYEPSTVQSSSGLKPTDEEIEQDIRNHLANNPDMAESDVFVTVLDGEAFLEGSTPNIESKKLAESITSECNGVKRVINNIVIKKPHEKNPQALL